MIITKRITGKIKDFASCEEIYWNSYGDLFFDDWDCSCRDYDYKDYHKQTYSVRYRDLLISYELDGEQKTLRFSTAYLQRLYAKNDLIELLYNRIRRTIELP